MIYFMNDYSEGAHEQILNALIRTNREQTVGYGMDEHCAEAKELIRKHLKKETTAIHFLVGGTQTNRTVITAILRPHQGVISASSGHINIHESGAIEASGHKVLPIQTGNGKITANEVEGVLRAHYDDETFEHMVQPAMVYLSQPTEVGTMYSKEELTAIHKVCQSFEIPLFVDGARLGCALTAEKNDVSIADLEELADVFYIGGTKMGALFGEAVIISNPKYQKDFRYLIKQNGGMFAKGRLLGIQFAELFRDDLYFKIGRHANAMARKLEEGIREAGYGFAFDSPTNQIFPIFPNDFLNAVREKYAWSFWMKFDETNTVIRLCTSWATEEKNVDAFLEDLSIFHK